MRNYYEHGSWNAICDRCGFKRKNHQLREEWTGLMVCADTCWEPRHPQTLLRVPEEDIGTPWARPEPDDLFVDLSGAILTEDGEDIESENSGPLFTET